MSKEAEGPFPETTGEIARVNAHLRTLTWIASGAALLAVAALALAAVLLTRTRPVEVPHAPTVLLDGPELTIRDQAGNVRGRWSSNAMSLVDETGRVRASISVTDAGAPNLTLFSQEGRVRAVMGLGSGDTPAITLHDEKGRVRTRVVVGDAGAPSVQIIDERGDVTGRLPAPVVTPGRVTRTGR